MSEHGRPEGPDALILGSLPPLDTRPGPARALPERKRRALINRALESVYGRLGPSRSRIWRHAVAAAFLFSLGSVATASVLLYRQRERPPAPELTTPARSQPRPPKRAARRTALVSPPVIEPAPLPLEPLRKPRVARATVQEMLQTAAELRAAQRWREAVVAYERVIQAAPRSDLVHTAAMNAAFLRLEHLGDAAGARRLFESVLSASPRNSLAEEGRWGRALSLRVLGDRRGERQALGEFLEAHPDSIRWARAEARYRELTDVP